MTKFVFRFMVGGTIVSLFAVLGDILRPKSFAGLFGAAPSVAIATLLLTIHQQGAVYAAVEARSMIGGAIAFCFYTGCVCWVVMRYKCSASIVAGLLLVVWLVTAVGLGVVWLR